MTDPQTDPASSSEVAISRRRRALRTGFTTGTCTSAAAKAAALIYLRGGSVTTVDVALPSGTRISFPVVRPCGSAPVARVTKDAGDDPDCTHGAHLTVEVAPAPAGPGKPMTRLVAGDGVGVVTRPGLGLAVGAPAINPVPRRMILAAVGEVTTEPLEVTVSVPGGQAMAEHTTNSRLGIVGGISILGTSGIVRPFSTAAYRASVLQQVDVAAASGEKLLVMATGSRSEVAAQRLFPGLDHVCFVEVGDYTGATLARARIRGMDRVVLVAMVGKITKLAAGVMMTHFRHSSVDGDVLVQAARATDAPVAVLQAATATATARHFYETCRALGRPEPLGWLCSAARHHCSQHVRGRVEVEVIMVDFEGQEVVARG
ncbi:MAG: cobalt-precorrin-5B (C(1))-methyltransferase [Acidimicrobiales bacterium]